MQRIKNLINKGLGKKTWAQNKALANHKIQEYLSEPGNKKIQFGCGPNKLSGWLNTDVYQAFPEAVFMDITCPLPLPSNTFSHITSEHLIEHIPYADGTQFIAECFRILNTNGKIRITTPDLRVIMNLYENYDEAAISYTKYITRNFIPEARHNQHVFVINNAFRNWGHQFIYDQKSLTLLLEETGFTDVRRVEPGESSDPELQNIDARHQSENKAINRYEVMVLEATKP